MLNDTVPNVPVNVSGSEWLGPERLQTAHERESKNKPVAATIERLCENDRAGRDVDPCRPSGNASDAQRRVKVRLGDKEMREVRRSQTESEQDNIG
jgi:hypothetical protein